MMQPLSSVCEIVMGQAPAGDTYNDDRVGLPLIAGASDFGEITPKPTRFTTAASKISRTNDIIVCVRATIGDLNWSDGEYCLGRGVAALRVNERKADRNYIWRAVEHGADRLTSLGRGATFKQISKSDIADFEIPIPPLGEQKRIAAILDQADELRSKRQRALHRLSQLGQAIFIEMFGDPAYGEADTIELSGLLKFVTSGGRGWSQYYVESGTRFVRSLDVQMNAISSSDAAFVNAPDNAEARRTNVQPGDVLLTITGSKIGRVAPVPPDFGPAFVSQHVAILRVDCMRLLPEFLSYYLSLSNGGQRQIAKHQYGQTKPGLNFDQIGRFLIPDVAIERQREFVRALTQIDAVSAQASNARVRDDQLFASLQSLAFRGELTASNLKEVAA